MVLKVHGSYWRSARTISFWFRRLHHVSMGAQCHEQTEAKADRASAAHQPCMSRVQAPIPPVLHACKLWFMKNSSSLWGLRFTWLKIEAFPTLSLSSKCISPEHGTASRGCGTVQALVLTSAQFRCPQGYETMPISA